MEEKVSGRIENAIAPLLEQEGMELVDLFYGRHGNKAALQFFIDKKDGSNITLDDCERLSDKIGGVLDMEDIIDCGYTLEVSSPGVNRVLKKPEHFRRFAGERVKITLKTPLEGRGFFTGVIASSDDRKMALEDGTNRFEFEFENIKTARLDPVLEF